MDRNKNFKPEVRDWFVALRKESVDRNEEPEATHVPCSVALRKESVDRNNSITATRTFEFDVALRKESMECFSF